MDILSERPDVISGKEDAFIAQGFDEDPENIAKSKKNQIWDESRNEFKAELHPSF